jgi:hypothetical protein
MSNRSIAEKRKRLFDLYSTNLSFYAPDAPELFVCPLCSVAFGRDALEGDNVLTLEHCISGKLGGTIETLTCQHCNNNHGSQFDAHLVSKHRNEDSMLGLGGTPLKGSLKIGGSKVQARVTIQSDPKQIVIQFVPKASHPAHVKAVIREIEEKGKIPDALKFNLTWSMGYARRNYEVALLRSAFLTLFSYFGYRYSHRPSSEVIRNQISNPSEVVFPPDYIMPLAEVFPASNCVTVVTSPSELKSFLVPIRSTSDRRTTIVGVMLPGFGSDAEGLYDRWRDMKIRQPRNKLRCNIISFDEGFLNDPRPYGNDEELWMSILNASASD